jgi:beta-glucanase (GH16 family)
MPAWVVLELDGQYEIGAIQLLTGYKQGDQYKAPLNSFNVQYWDGKKWQEISFPRTEVDRLDLSRDYLVYALEWNEEELIWYIDGKEVRRERNEFCHAAAPVILSSAVVKSAGSTAHIDGTSMKVDYVRIYQRKKEK